jgi:adenine/guanine phosphoribosyltransferase-like PRPP-binding protein
VRKAFTVSDPAAVAGKHVLVIDDIFTTGATARAAAKTLLDAGAASVWVATLARAGMRDSRRVASTQFDETESETVREDFEGAGIFSSHDQSSF